MADLLTMGIQSGLCKSEWAQDASTFDDSIKQKSGLFGKRGGKESSSQCKTNCSRYIFVRCMLFLQYTPYMFQNPVVLF